MSSASDPLPPPATTTEPVGTPAPATPALPVLTAKERAERALREPIAPALGTRCPRCGERLLTDAPTKDCPRCRVDTTSEAAGALLVPQGTWIRELIRGATYLPRGFGRLVISPSLWKWAVIPLVLNILVVVLSLVVAYQLVGWLQNQTSATALQSWADAGGLWWIMSKVVWVLGYVATWLVWIMLPLLSTWLICAFPFSILYKLLFMPFMELMTESAERLVLKFDEDQPFDFGRVYANLVIAIVDAIFLTLMQGLLFVLLLPINIIPFLGSMLWMVLPPALFSGMDYTDINLVRRKYTTTEKLKLWRTHEWRFLGYGLSFFFLITIPLLNVVAIPCAAVGGALLYLELDRK
jgi:CysZ protein